MAFLFRMMIDPVNNTKEDVCQVFMKQRQYVRGRYFDDDGLVQDENKTFIDLDAQPASYMKEPSPPFTLVKVEKGFGR